MLITLGRLLVMSRGELERRAYHDHLTGLPNRQLFQDRLNVLIAESDRIERKLGVLYLDLDGFKAINDTHGHHFGDEVLRITAYRLERIVRKSDTVARIGGDEFAVILPNLNTVESLHEVAGKIRDCLDSPVNIGRLRLKLGVSVGSSLYPDDTQEAEVLVRQADQAMYAAKAVPESHYCYFGAMKEASS